VELGQRLPGRLARDENPPVTIERRDAGDRVDRDRQSAAVDTEVGSAAADLLPADDRRRGELTRPPGESW